VKVSGTEETERELPSSLYRANQFTSLEKTEMPEKLEELEMRG